jgi:hypothetical protein
MAGSGRLAAEMATILAVPHADIATVVKALRARRILNVTGRGSNAAQMTPADAAAILVGVMSGAPSTSVSAITAMLLDMECRYSIHAEPGKEALLKAPQHAHRFRDALVVLLEGEPNGRPLEVLTEEGLTIPNDDLLVTVGVDGARTGGFAVIDFCKADSPLRRYLYSTLPRARSSSPDHAQTGLGLQLYERPPKFTFQSAVAGSALADIRQTLTNL